MHGIGLGGWLTNYRRFCFIPPELRKNITEGDIQHFDSYITKKDIESIANWGMDHIRFAFDYLIIEEDSYPFVYKENGFKYLDRCLNWCKEVGLNIVFDLHKAAGASCDYTEAVTLVDNDHLQERFIKLWCNITKRYLSEGDNIAFELLNEIAVPDSEKWNILVKKTINAIREIDGKRKIIVGCNGYNSVLELRNLKVYDDENIIYNFHCYEPFEFTHQKAVCQPVLASFNRYLDYPSDLKPYYDYKKFVNLSTDLYDGLERMDKKFLERWLEPAIDFLHKHNKPLYCGEFGVIRHANMKSRENWYRDVIAILDANGIGHSAWNYLSTPYDANRFSLVDDESRKPLSDELLRIIR
jgi:hypothetical protein